MLYCKLATSWPQCHKPWETWKIYSLCSFSKYSVPVRPWGVSQRVRLWGQPGATAATYRARKEVLKGAGHKLCWPLTLTTAVVVVLIHSIAFYTVFLGNMVSAVFKGIHTEKCKKLLLFFFWLLMFLEKMQNTIPTHSPLFWKCCRRTLLSQAWRALWAPSQLRWEAGLLFDLTSFTFVLIFSSIVQVREK